MNAWRHRFESRSMRERILIAVTFLTAVWGVWLLTLGGSVMDYTVEVETDVNRLASQLRQTTDQRRANIQRWPEHLALIAERDSLEAVVESRDEDINDILGNTIGPQAVRELVAAVVKQHSGIQLVEMKNLPAEEIVLDGEASGLFRHPLQLTISGGYADVTSYVRALEQFPRRLNWRQMTYVVDEYPKARVVFVFESLSRHKAWIGV